MYIHSADICMALTKLIYIRVYVCVYIHIWSILGENMKEKIIQVLSWYRDRRIIWQKEPFGVYWCQQLCPAAREQETVPCLSPWPCSLSSPWGRPGSPRLFLPQHSTSPGATQPLLRLAVLHISDRSCFSLSGVHGSVVLLPVWAKSSL